MKLYISVDIEGITGVTSWSETNMSNREAFDYIKQMEKETIAVCKSAYELGYDEIIVKDAHETGRNMNIFSFPPYVKMIRGWSGHPMAMIEGLDDSFDAIAFVGFHSSSSKGTSPLSHTMHVSKINSIKINGVLASEFLIFYYAGLYFNVPVVFLSGDRGICEEVSRVNTDIFTVATKEGFGRATLNQHPDIMINTIGQTFSKTTTKELSTYLRTLPSSFEIEIEYKNPAIAYWASFYPNAYQKTDNTIAYATNDYMDVLKLFSFVIREK